MILVDTSIWIDHLRTPDARLDDLLAREEVGMHPFVLGELALGGLSRRSETLKALGKLEAATVAKPLEVLRLIDRSSLVGSGIGYVDAHLVAATLLTKGAVLWTRDRKLAKAAQDCGAEVLHDVH